MVKRLMPYGFMAAAFYVVPPLIGDTGGMIWLLLIAFSMLCAGIGLTDARRDGFSLWPALAGAILFAPTLLLYYNSSAWIYIPMFAGAALASSEAGYLVRKKVTCIIFVMQ